MGNNNTRIVKSEAVFRQSLYDFPCPVTLGKYTPSFGLHRFKQGLRFVPPDDEGFTLRGDKQRLVYKGQRRSHRFTILGDCSFEYDCILKREPESNVISLRMEGAENYDFFRQPYFVKEPFLKGSYAVYKKDTLVGEGTGKLCHIHRPEIIDARGRRCWGDLAVAGNELRITIPEQWLSEAKYPMVVDPTVGTTTVGSLYLWEPDPGEGYEQLTFNDQIPVNRFLVPDTINGTCTAYLYTNDSNYQGEGYGRPVLYSDNNNKPQTRKSMNEGLADFHISNGHPKGWRNAAFTSNGAIASGSYIWFGVFAEYYWEARFDYGNKCYTDFWDMQSYNPVIPNTYPIFNANWYENFRLSMYFTYTVGQNYQRTLTQGVSLPDSRRITGSYNRKTSQTVQANAAPTRRLSIFKGIQDTLSGFSHAARLHTIAISIYDTLCSLDLETRVHSVLSSIKDTLSFFETSKTSFLHFRNIHEALITSDTLHHIRNIIRGLIDNVGMESEAKTGFVHFRTISETAQAISSVFRGMVFFARIVTGVFVRDYLLGRFLKSKTELALKSCVTREIVLESTLGEKGIGDENI